MIRAAAAFDADGLLLALDHEWLGNVGAHTVSIVPMANGTRMMSTVYHVPVATVLVSAALSNTVPYRGTGRPEASHVMERLLDIAACEMDIDRMEIRCRNLVGKERLPYRSPIGLHYDSGDFRGNMEKALEMADWSGFAARQQAARAQGRLLGIGLANYVESPVGAPRERIVVNLLPEGVVAVVSGTQSTEQGHETTFVLVLAQQLGVPMDSIRLRTGDTEFVAVGGGTHSDRSMRLGGTLLVEAAAKIRAAAEFNGRMAAYPTGCAVCEVEVDAGTGVSRILRYTSVDDVGKPINPMIVEGQVHGGLAQGIGQAFSEGYFVERDSGQVLIGSYMDYGVPPLAVALTEDPTAGNPLGVKGGGESGITPATAVIFNALADALRGLGVDGEPPMPASPGALWDFMQGDKR